MWLTAPPSYSRILTALQSDTEHPNLELQLLVAASALLERYGVQCATLRTTDSRSPPSLHGAEGENLAAMPKTTGLACSNYPPVFDNLKAGCRRDDR